MRYPGHTTNDLWLTIAQALGQDMTVFGGAERCTGALDGLFGAAPPTGCATAGREQDPARFAKRRRSS